MKVSVVRNAVVLLSASYHSGLARGRGWAPCRHGDGGTSARRGARRTGVHTVRFVYKGFPDYPQLFVLAALALVGLVIFEKRPMTRRSGRTT